MLRSVVVVVVVVVAAAPAVCVVAVGDRLAIYSLVHKRNLTLHSSRHHITYVTQIISAVIDQSYISTAHFLFPEKGNRNGSDLQAGETSNCR